MPSGGLLDQSLVADFLMEKDELFAKLTLDAQEFALYKQIHTSLKLEPPKPDLVIYLQAPTDVLLQRIQRRGLESELQIDADYLASLSESYTEFFHYYDDAPLLVVNAAEIDFANNDIHFDHLFEHVLNMEGSRQFFNPNPTLL